MFSTLIHQGLAAAVELEKNELFKSSKIWGCLSCVLPSGANAIISLISPHLPPLMNFLKHAISGTFLKKKIASSQLKS